MGRKLRVLRSTMENLGDGNDWGRQAQPEILCITYRTPKGEEPCRKTLTNQAKGVKSRSHVVRGHSQRSCVMQGQCDDKRQPIPYKERTFPCAMKFAGLRVQAPSQVKYAEIAMAVG